MKAQPTKPRLFWAYPAQVKEWLIHRMGGFTLTDKFLPPPIRTATIMTFWTYGSPELGMRIDVPMKSGMTAVYELTSIDYNNSCDWDWLNLTFHHYKDEKL